MRKLPFFLLCFISAILAFSSLIIFYPREKQVETAQKTYIELWHIDTFEGGVGSRRAFLEKAALSYQKKSDTVVIVKEQTIYSAEQNFSNNVYPDMISFGSGIKLPYDRLVSLKTGKTDNNNKEIISKNEKSGGNDYAKVWCMGGYVKITRKGVSADGLIISDQKNAMPYLAAKLSGESLPVKQVVDSDKAVYSFYSDKNAALVGTQRDLFRLENKGIDIDVVPYTGYNDLYQYVSVISENDEKAFKCGLFIDYLLSDEIAEKLDGIGMLSLDKSGKVKAKNSPTDVFDSISYSYALPAFTTASSIAKLKNLANDYERNSESIKSTLKYLK